MQSYLLIQKKNVLTGFFGTKQNLLKTCINHTSKMKKATILKRGLSIVKIGSLNSKKCDIYATPIASTYSGDLTPCCKIFYKFRNRGGNGRNHIKLLNSLYKQSTTTFFKAVEGGRVSQFLAVFVHLACEAIFVNYFLHGRPKSPLIV
jgi:hypothetical protein